MQPIGSLYVKLSGDNNWFKLRTYGETAKGVIRIEWLKMRLTIEIIVQDYSEISS